MPTRRQFMSSAVATTLALPIIGTPTFAADNAWAVKMFEKTKHDFGVVARGADSNYRLKIKNLYEQVVHIADVQTSCGCTAGKPSKDTLQSLEEAYIEIKMDTRKFIRRKDSTLTVTFDRPIAATVDIEISAYIRTDVVVEPGSAQFGAVDAGTGKSQTLKIAYAGRDTWKIKEIKTANNHITAKAVETARGNGRVDYSLEVVLAKDAPVGPLRQYITLITDDETGPKVPVLVEADVKPDIVVNPAVLSLGTMKPGQQIVRKVILRGKKPFKVDSVTCEKAAGVFEVDLPTKASLIQIIPLTITAPKKNGSLDEELQVTIPGRKEPVKVRAYGKISG
jgi:hypothetical protein